VQLKASDAVGHLYQFHTSPGLMQAELDRLVTSGELTIAKPELEQICALFKLEMPAKLAAKAGANSYGTAGTFSAGESKGASGAAGAQLKVAELARGETVALGDFAAERNRPGTGYSYYSGTTDQLIDLIKANWATRVPGAGREPKTEEEKKNPNLKEVVIVKVPAAGFMTTTVMADEKMPFTAAFVRRRAHEEPFVRVTSTRDPEPAEFASVVLYHKDTLGKNGERSTKADWEIVTIIASPVENEPMDPVTMMRNMRGKSGGTLVTYTAEQLLEAIEFWSNHVRVLPK